jgi:hypothetical protein
MGAEQRRHERFGVRLSVRYTNAEQFVTDYVENLSSGGLFIAGAHPLPLHSETDVHIELPGQGAWTVRARSLFILGPEEAVKLGRKAGAGMQIIDKPPGFDDALLGYLLRLGRRREHAVMIADDMIGRSLVEDAGFRVIPLESQDEVAFALADGSAMVLAIVVPPALAASYRDSLGKRSKDLVFSATTVAEIADILARIDSLF